ncbi:MAG TPA: cupin domain-containing protein [Polyangiaceae bacterium]|nr:cupin domain-containing protein [Polyangiaceae bacterium]
MACTPIDFVHMPWLQGAHPLEQKKPHPESGTTLLRFAPGFADPNWCERSHLFFVLEGCLGLELETETLTIDAGHACHVEAGTRHRAHNPEASDAVVFAISDFSLDQKK